MGATRKPQAKSQKKVTNHKYSLFDSTHIPIFIINKQHKVVFWNKACEKLTGMPSKDVIKTDAHQKVFYKRKRKMLADYIVSSSPHKTIKKRYGRNLSKSSNLECGYELTGYYPKINGSGKWLFSTAAPIKDKAGRLIGALETMEDITEKAATEKELKKATRELNKVNDRLEKLTLIDAHTGLFNLRYLSSALDKEFSLAQRHGYALSLVMMDIDFFKSINDAYGLEFGNLVLKQFVDTLNKTVRMGDTLIRYAGEEFIILCPKTDRKKATKLSERLLDALAIKSFGDKNNKVKLKLSIGIASYPEDNILKGKNLISLADFTLEKAKAEGGNRTYSSLNVTQEKKKVSSYKQNDVNLSLLKSKINQLSKETNQNVVDAVFAFAKTIKLKDHYTGDHVANTVHYAAETARALGGLAPEEIQRIKQAAVLHDLGKIGISDEILLKNGKLTKKEYNIIKRHPLIARDILQPIHALQDIIPLVLYHHERWDGKGYPSGLKKEQIPMGARIIALADVYHALVSDRPYRQAYSKLEAIKIIEDGVGKNFDPNIAKTFLSVVREEKSPAL
jgi:diguanylate cyclase (GGDEF)-like protein/PAS domain S-box-containing protein